MESSLLSSNAMGMNNYSSAKNYIDKIKSRVASVGGVLTVLWHNSDIYEDWHHDLLEHILAEL
jgi:hypothetical protein